MAKKIIVCLKKSPMSKSELSVALGHSTISGKLNLRVSEMLNQGLIERTIPDKPNSRLQKYRLTEKGRTV
jgi:ATP-dependent DNA helicase RecG